ncbi:tetratricopeptide repeat protein [Nocardia sp. SYP-A9097]|uniref:tetratricopeptide repeat protein n=1 Tax=Nocardia sp. SYP-A9097 TaxID=2663237 RepID=UPI00129A861A|nr:tetratricopeptide repeat protein [Nocardia sp. SYP-A9097]MRH92270.1 tetratricopeptide repeat protein [Nocardia sp. SYP-A9097]
MNDSELTEQLESFIEFVRRKLDGKSMAGLDVWAARFGELRQSGQYELCRQLAHAIRTTIDPKDHQDVGVVRYAEGWLYDRIGEKRNAIKAYTASLVAFRKAEIPLDSTIMCQIGSVHQDRGDWEKAGLTYQVAIACARDDHDRGLALNNLGNLAVQKDNLPTAEEHYRAARELLRDIDKRNFAAATHGLAIVLLGLEEPQQSQDMHAECVHLFQALGDYSGVASAVGGVANAQRSASHPREAIHNYEQVLRIDMNWALDPSIGVQTLTNLALAHQDLGEFETALQYLSDAIPGYNDLGDRRGETSALVNLVLLHQLRGDHAAAEQAAADARTAAERYGFPDELRRLPPGM